MEPTSNACTIPDFAKGRLNKAWGHINATEGRLWHDTDRGLWSAKQAKARLAEAWLWLENGTEFPPLDRYLAREVVQARLEAFAQGPMSDAVKAAWTEVGAAEQAILETGFPSLKSPMKGLKREALEAGLARKYRYLNALLDLKRRVEDAIAERFVDLRPGDWVQVKVKGGPTARPTMTATGPTGDWVRVKVKGGPTGRVLSLEGLTVRLFKLDLESELDLLTELDLEWEDGDRPNYVVSEDWEKRVRRYTLLFAEIIRVRPPKHPPITEPSYYWMLSAYERFRETSHLVKCTDWVLLAHVDEMLSETLDAAAMAWWATFAPGHPHVVSGRPFAQNVERLESRAPPAVSEPLNCCLRRLRALTNERNAAVPGGPENWQAAIEEMLSLVEEGLTALEPLLAPWIDLVTGDRVLSNHGSGRIATRDATKIVVDLGPCGLREFDLFREFLQRIPSSGEEERCHDL